MCKSVHIWLWILFSVRLMVFEWIYIYIYKQSDTQHTSIYSSTHWPPPDKYLLLQIKSSTSVQSLYYVRRQPRGDRFIIYHHSRNTYAQPAICAQRTLLNLCLYIYIYIYVFVFGAKKTVWRVPMRANSWNMSMQFPQKAIYFKYISTSSSQVLHHHTQVYQSVTRITLKQVFETNIYIMYPITIYIYIYGRNWNIYTLLYSKHYRYGNPQTQTPIKQIYIYIYKQLVIRLTKISINQLGRIKCMLAKDLSFSRIGIWRLGKIICYTHIYCFAIEQYTFHRG